MKSPPVMTHLQTIVCTVLCGILLCGAPEALADSVREEVHHTGNIPLRKTIYAKDRRTSRTNSDRFIPDMLYPKPFQRREELLGTDSLSAFPGDLEGNQRAEDLRALTNMPKTTAGSRMLGLFGETLAKDEPAMSHGQQLLHRGGDVLSAAAHSSVKGSSWSSLASMFCCPTKARQSRPTYTAIGNGNDTEDQVQRNPETSHDHDQLIIKASTLDSVSSAAAFVLEPQPYQLQRNQRGIVTANTDDPPSLKRRSTVIMGTQVWSNPWRKSQDFENTRSSLQLSVANDAAVVPDSATCSGLELPVVHNYSHEGENTYNGAVVPDSDLARGPQIDAELTRAIKLKENASYDNDTTTSSLNERTTIQSGEPKAGLFDKLISSTDHLKGLIDQYTNKYSTDTENEGDAGDVVVVRPGEEAAHEVGLDELSASCENILDLEGQAVRQPKQVVTDFGWV
eukprot:GHVQ01041945.1.p1 GENE.GHVQ01041945.1~~GHVQ01041945.1.p1  ORF type:complete len:453 (+),score=67.07 GHVQ01041945.1:188-1546(+)